MVWAKTVLHTAKARALKAGVALTITAAEVASIAPSRCPVLGIELDYGAKTSLGPRDNSPSMDRLRPDLGYVPGNVAVVSVKANTIKNNATPAELRAVADWLERQLHSSA